MPFHFTSAFFHFCLIFYTSSFNMGLLWTPGVILLSYYYHSNACYILSAIIFQYFYHLLLRSLLGFAHMWLYEYMISFSFTIHLESGMCISANHIRKPYYSDWYFSNFLLAFSVFCNPFHLTFLKASHVLLHGYWLSHGCLKTEDKLYRLCNRCPFCSIYCWLLYCWIYLQVRYCESFLYILQSFFFKVLKSGAHFTKILVTI